MRNKLLQENRRTANFLFYSSTQILVEIGYFFVCVSSPTIIIISFRFWPQKNSNYNVSWYFI